MTAGSLVINLGVKGADLTVSALKTAGNTLKDLTSTSLATKAGIVGVFYALQQFGDKSNNMGMDLKMFGQLTELSMDKLQRWQYVLRQTGVSTDETAQSIETLQSSLGKLILNKGTPEGLLAITNKVGNVDINRLAKGDAFYFMDILKQYAQLTRGQGIAAPVNEFLKSIGISNSVIQGLKDPNLLNLNAVPGANRFSGNQIQSLAKMKAGWGNLADTIDHSFGKLNVKFGPSLLKDLTKLTGQVLLLVDAFATLSEKLHVIEGIGKVFEGWTEIFKVVTDTVNDVQKNGVGSYLNSAKAITSNLAKEAVQNLGHAVSSVANNVHNELKPNTVVNINGVDTSNAAAVGSVVSKEINRSFRQLNGNGAVGGH